jgi:hypothetical protein
MPLNPPALAAGFLAPNLISTGNIGIGVPKFSLGVAIGVCQYLTVQSKVLTVDTGTLGAGTSIFPLIVPFPLLQGYMAAAFAQAGLMGFLAPPFILGLSNGLTTGWLALALLQTNHPGIGVGAGVARIIGPPAASAMMMGFASVGMVGNGPIKMARAIGSALDMTFATWFLPVPIVGAGSPVGGAGVGFGTVI